MLATLLLLAFASVAAVTDLLWSKIYNWTTYTGILVAFVLSAVTSCVVAADPSAASRLRNWLNNIALLDSFEGLLLCGLLMVACLVVFPGIGGGDVKLMAMLGAWLGWEKGVEALLWTFVLAACFGLVGLVWKVGPLKTISLVVRMFANKLRPLWFIPPSESERKLLKPPIFIGPSALAAVVIVRFGLIT